MNYKCLSLHGYLSGFVCVRYIHVDVSINLKDTNIQLFTPSLKKHLVEHTSDEDEETGILMLKILLIVLYLLY